MPRLPDRLRPVHWTVQSPDYGWPDEADPDVPVWISLARFDALWRRTDEYIAQAGGADDNQPEKYARVGQWLGSGKPTWMPVVGLDCDGLPTITDGRHRYLWMREHGAWSIPVAVSASDAAAVEALCGTRYRRSWYVLPQRVTYGALAVVIGLAAVAALVARRLGSDAPTSVPPDHQG